MKQKYKNILFDDLNLSLRGASTDGSSDGMAQKLMNIECNNGHIKSAPQLKNIFEFLEPQRANSASQVFKDKLNGCKWVTGFQFYDQSVQVDTVVFCDEDNKIYYYKLGEEYPQFVRLDNINFSSTPTVETFIKDGKNTMILCSQTDNMWVWDGISEPYEVLDAPKVSNMAVAMERLFVVSQSHPYSVLYSDDLDPSNWSIMSGEAGEICFNDNLGRVLKVFALDNYLYVVRDYGIIKIYALSSNGNFHKSIVYMSTCEIYKNTLCTVGDKIVFYCGDGVYSFDGLNNKKLCSDLNGLIYSPENAVAVCLDNIYYLCANLYSKSLQNNAIISISLKDNLIKNVIFDTNFTNICKINAKNKAIIAITYKQNDEKNAKTPVFIVKNGNQNDKTAKFLFLSHEFDVAPKCKDKVLKSISFVCTNNAKLTIYGLKTLRLDIKGKPTLQTIKLNLKTQFFAIEFSGIGDVDISHVVLDYCYME